MVKIYRLFNERCAIPCKRGGTDPTCPMHSICCDCKTQKHDDESEDSSDDSKFDAFAEELHSNWDDLFAYG